MEPEPEQQPKKRGRGRGRNNRTAALAGAREPMLAMPGVDGRELWPRLQNRTFSEVISHLGGYEVTSELERIAARRIGTFEAELLHLERRFAELRSAGKAPTIADLDLYGRLSGHQHRLSVALGFKRQPRDVTPDLKTYLEASSSIRQTVENAVYDAVVDTAPLRHSAPDGEPEQLRLVDDAVDHAAAHGTPSEPQHEAAHD